MHVLCTNTISYDGEPIQIEVVAAFLLSFGAQMNILSSVDRVFSKWPYNFPPLCCLLNLERLSQFEHVVGHNLFQTRVILVSILGGTVDHLPLKCMCRVRY